MPDPYFPFAANVAPICQIGMSDIQQAEPTSWLDVSCYVHTCEVFRGRDRFTDRFQPGTCSITFSNSNGWADLAGGGFDVAAAPCRPGRPLRIGVRGPWDTDGVITTRWLWRGWIDQCTPRYDPTEHDVVDVNGIDPLGEAGTSTIMTNEFQGANETTSARIHRILDAADWPSSKRRVDGSSTTVQGTSFGSTGIDLMGVTADSEGGVVHGDTDGDVVFRNRDWMLYDPDDPPDGTIGNVDPGTPGHDGPPPYVDPGKGPVWDDDPPPIRDNEVIHFCGDGSDGTMVKYGSIYRLYAETGQLRFTLKWLDGTIHTTDLGSYTGGALAVLYNRSTGNVRRLVQANAEDCNCVDDPHCPIWIAPDPCGDPPLPPCPPEVPTPAVVVSMVGLSESGQDDGVIQGFTMGPINPGPNCLLVLLVNAVCNGDGVVMPLLDIGGTSQGGVAGGALEWLDSFCERTGFSGAESGCYFAVVGADPGGFLLSVDFAGTDGARFHAASLWKVTNYATDLPARMAIDVAAWKHAHTHGHPPGSAHADADDADGKGFWTVALEDSRTATPTTNAGDVVLAQSLAQSPNDPWAAIFNEADGLWSVPALLATGQFRDDFGRPDGLLGGSYATPAGVPAALEWVPYQILDGYAFQSTLDDGGGAPFQTAGVRITEPFPDAQAIQVTLSRVDVAGITDVYLFTRMTDANIGCVCARFTFDSGADVVSGSLFAILPDGSPGTTFATYPATAYDFAARIQTSTVRFEMTPGGAVGGEDDLLLVEPFDNLDAWDTTGELVAGRDGTGLHHSGIGTSSHYLDPADASPAITVGMSIKIGTHLNPTFPLQFRHTAAGTAVENLITFAVTTDSRLQILRGGSSGTVIGSTDPGMVTTGVWYTIEVAVAISDTAGTAIVRLDGAEVLHLSGVDTLPTGATATIDTIALVDAFLTNDTWDDVYIRHGGFVANEARAFLDGTLVLSGTGDAPAGQYVGFATRNVTAPCHVESVEAGPTVRKASWIAGNRTGVVASDILWETVNIGPDNLQSSQAIAVIEPIGSEDTNRLEVGGSFNGPIYHVEATEGPDPNDGEIIWTMDPGEGVLPP